MAYKTNSAPYLRTKKSTLQIMIELGIALAIVWLAAVVTSFIKLGSGYGLKSILLMVVALAVTAGCDAINTVLTNKKDKTLLKKIGYDVIHNYSWITAIIFTLCCPVWTSYYVIVVGSIFSTVIAKLVFGGFGKNIFNPAAMGRILVQLCFDMSAPKDVTAGLDATTGATLTGVVNSSQQWLGSFALEGYSMMDILLGNYFGTMGETFTILIIILGVVLSIRGVINWRAPAFYLGTIAVTSLLIGLILGFENPLLYVVFHVGLGGAAFGAVFMLTDPVTTPTSPFGNCLVGVIAALLTMLIRICTNGAEGVVYSIAIVNMISPSLDSLITGKTGDKQLRKSLVTFGTSAATIAAVVCAAWFTNGGKEVNTINGIGRQEYDELVATTNYGFMEENNYEFALYEGNTPSTTLPTVGNLQSIYSIVDENGNQVAVVYTVAGEFAIEMGGHAAHNKATILVAISTETDNIIGISLGKGGFSGSAYGSKVNEQLSGYDYANSDFTLDTTITADGNTGVTFSMKGIQEIVKSACELHASLGN